MRGELKGRKIRPKWEFARLRKEAGENASLIQTNAAISPGSSGGGLFDSEGRLIGLTTWKIREGENLNFAIPVDWVLELK